jgi:hypothetical protein
MRAWFNSHLGRLRLPYVRHIQQDPGPTALLSAPLLRWTRSLHFSKDNMSAPKQHSINDLNTDNLLPPYAGNNWKDFTLAGRARGTPLLLWGMAWDLKLVCTWHIGTYPAGRCRPKSSKRATTPKCLRQDLALPRA